MLHSLARYIVQHLVFIPIATLADSGRSSMCNFPQHPPVQQSLLENVDLVIFRTVFARYECPSIAQ